MSIEFKDRLRLFTEDGESISFKVYYVKSSNVLLVGYPATGEPMMLAQFEGSGVRYGYLGVPWQRVVAAATAPSVGKYINERIKPKYKAVRLGS
jgi:hypothetical protein